MATVTPMHGKLGAMYVLRPNGFSGSGVNDATWNTADALADSAYYSVTIATKAAPDTADWLLNGGGGGAVNLTGAAVAIGGTGLTILHTTFNNSHTVGDKWEVANLFAEPTTVVGSTAQITDTLFRMINPNNPPTFTPTNAVNLVSIDYTKGIATFDGAPGVTTVAGNNGVIYASALQKVGYLIDWNLNVTLDMADASRMGQAWKESLPGQAGASGGASGYFVADQTLFNCLTESIAAGEKYYLLQLFTYDPDQDQTGDHYNVWATFNNFSVAPTISEVVKETVSFQVFGGISTIIDNV